MKRSFHVVASLAGGEELGKTSSASMCTTFCLNHKRCRDGVASIPHRGAFACRPAGPFFRTRGQEEGHRHSQPPQVLLLESFVQSRKSANGLDVNGMVHGCYQTACQSSCKNSLGDTCTRTVSLRQIGTPHLLEPRKLASSKHGVFVSNRSLQVTSVACLNFVQSICHLDENVTGTVRFCTPLKCVKAAPVTGRAHPLHAALLSFLCTTP